jgi:GntR family transcriptional regulator
MKFLINAAGIRNLPFKSAASLLFLQKISPFRRVFISFVGCYAQRRILCGIGSPALFRAFLTRFPFSCIMKPSDRIPAKTSPANRRRNSGREPLMPKDYQKELAIREDLAYQIQHHRFAEGEKLPSEYELAEKYNVTRITVRNVYLTLQEMGFIYSKQGVGHFVQKKIGNIELLLKSGSSFSEKMRRQNIPCETVNLFCRRISYSKALFERLEASESEEVFCIARLRILYHFPAAIHFSYLLKSKFPTIDRDGPSITSIFNYYHRLGHRNLLASPAPDFLPGRKRSGCSAARWCRFWCWNTTASMRTAAKRWKKQGVSIAAISSSTG